MLDRTHFHRSYRTLGSVCALLTCAGLACNESDWQWSRGTASAGKPTRSIRPAEPRSTGAAPQEAASPAGPSEAPGEPEAFYQLVLISEPTPVNAPPGLRYIRLEHANARDVADLVGILYIPAGPTGTMHRFTLIYPSATEVKTAGAWATGLDVSPRTDGPGPVPDSLDQAFLDAVAVLYGTPTGHPKEAERLNHAVSVLARVYGAADQLGPRRWAAALIAGAIAADRLYDYEQAETHFLVAGGIAPPGSFEQMTTQYRRALAHIQNGHPDLARDILTQVIANFGMFRRSEVFERARRALGELDAKRP